MKYLITLCVLALGFVPGTFAAVIYVDVDATGSNDGSSWEDAFDNITNALNVAVNGDELWVARGTYFTTETDNANLVFWLPCGVSMYGGFQGNETERIERNWNVNPTILSGEIGDENDLTDNSNGMIYVSGCGSNIKVSGFTISDCYSETFGAAIDIINSESVEIRHCIIENNTFPTGIATFNTDLLVKNVLMTQNDLGTGLSVLGVSGHTEVLNSTFADNGSLQFFSQGGVGSSLDIYNSVFWNIDGQPSLGSNCQNLNNTILQGNITADNAVNWIDEDPLFVDAVDADYRLQDISPAVDAGDDGLISQGFDLARNYRIMGDVVDIGCYEYRIPTVMYVDADAAGMNTGMDWENAFETLTDALAFTRTNDELWVAEGTYLPEPFDEDGFNINEEIRVFGGFDGTETQRNQRDWINNPTILSADIGVLGDDSDNAHHVLRYSLGNAFPEPSVLNGFTIESGRASGFGFDEFGGGILIIGAPTLTIRNCTFRDNEASSDGGALFIGDVVQDLLISQCVFESNQAISGSAIYTTQGLSDDADRRIDIQSCLFVQNTSFNTGILNFAEGDDVEVTNSTFYANGVSFTEGARIIDGDAMEEEWLFANNILWDNAILNISEDIRDFGPATEVRNSILQYPYSGNATNVFNVDPQFANPGLGDFSLEQDSPGINNGDDTYVEENLDVTNGPRVLNGNVDLGAVETELVAEGVIYVDADANGNNDGSSWTNAFNGLGDALEAATAGESVWIAEGYYVSPGLSNAWIIPDGVNLIGGFEGIEWEEAQADPVIHETILTGDTGLDNDPSNDVIAILQIFQSQSVNRISGIVIENANTSPQQGGPVIFLSNTFAPSNSIGQVLLERCVIRDCNIPEDFLISVVGNQAEQNVMIVQIDNCLIHGMENVERIISLGGNSVGRMNHCTIEYASNDPVIHAIGSGSSMEVNNSIIWNYFINPVFFGLSDIQANSSIFPYQDVAGEDNLYTLPDWIDPANDNFRLQEGSIAVNSGNNNLTNVDIDLDGNERIQGGTVDRGCYESSFTIECPADLDNDGVVASSDLLLFLAAYGSNCLDYNCPEDFTGDANVNVSDLLVFLAAYGAPCQ